MSTIKVFRVNDYEWWAGESLEAIKPVYTDECGYDADDEDGGFADPHELTAEQMQAHHMYELSEDWDIERDEDEPPTFQEYLDLLVRKGRQFPCLFASTEY